MVPYKQVLKQVPLFSDLTDRELNLLVALGSRRKYPSKNIIFQEGDPGDFLLVILLGKVKVMISGKGGEEFILTMLEAGSFFGEMALLEGGYRSATVVTVEPSEFLRIEKKDFSELLRKQPRLALKILKSLSQRLRKATEQIRSLVMFNIDGRVGRCLLNLAETHGERVNEQLVIMNRPSFKDLAQMVGCSRETLSRAMKTLRSKGCLTITRNAIYIHKVWE